MLIDWFTVGAQALNFLVLVWLLKRYLYGPVLAAIDAREKQIALAIADATTQKAAAAQERAALAAKQTALDGESAALLQRAAGAAEAEGAKLLADARAEAYDLRVKQMATLRDDQTRLYQSIAHLAQQEVLAIARTVLGELADASLEERIAVVFTQNLRALDSTARKSLAAAFGVASDAVVRSAFELAEAQRALIQSAVHDEFSSSIALRFEVSAETLCGVELLVGGEKLAWSMADYLSGLEQRLASMSAPARGPSRPASQATSAVATV
jgi:F-type H+-transporting ATPase subunit b